MMQPKACFLLIFSILAAIVAAADNNDASLHLSSSNFTNVTDGKDFIILFFSPYCGHCSKFKPTWKNFAAEVQGQIGVGDVDCTKESYLEGQFSIQGYPTVILLKDGHKYEFEGNRTVDGLKNFIKDGYLKADKSSAPTISEEDAKNHSSFRSLNHALSRYLILGISAAAIGLMFFFCCCFDDSGEPRGFMAKKLSKPKDDDDEISIKSTHASEDSVLFRTDHF